VLLQPPHPPQALALAALGVPPSQADLAAGSRGADALWAAEQVLRSGSCGALLFWPTMRAAKACAACTWRRNAAKPCSS
jgi:hypothetical protein